MPNDAFRVETHGEITIIVPDSVVESLQLDLVDQAAEILIGPCTQSEGRSVIVDLSQVKFFGSVFLSLLLRVWKAVTQNGGTLVLCDVSRQARELLKITSLDTLWALYDSRREAMEALSSE